MPRILLPIARTDVNVRPVYRSDLPWIDAIDRLSFPHDPLRTSGLTLRQVDGECLIVAEYRHAVTGDMAPIGYLLYRQEGSALIVSRIAVAPEYRRQRVGRQLLDYLFRLMSPVGLSELLMVVPETNMAAIRFLKALTFKAVEVKRGWAGEEDGYLFRFGLAERPGVVNRIERYCGPVDEFGAPLEM